MKRRSFIGALVSLACFLIFIPLYQIRSIFNRFKKPVTPNEYELRVAAVVAEYIYPRDTAPGAIDLGIQNFFTIQFKDPWYRRHIPVLVRFAGFLDQKARDSSVKDFLSLDASKQRQILDAIASGSFDMQIPRVKTDFNTLIDMTLEGCFSDPMHGGNQDKQAWKILDGTLNEKWFNV